MNHAQFKEFGTRPTVIGRIGADEVSEDDDHMFCCAMWDVPHES
jgi:hypothetical protein